MGIRKAVGMVVRITAQPLEVRVGLRKRKRGSRRQPQAAKPFAFILWSSPERPPSRVSARLMKNPGVY